MPARDVWATRRERSFLRKNNAKDSIFGWKAAAETGKGISISCVSRADLVGFGEKPGWQNREKFPSGFLGRCTAGMTRCTAGSTVCQSSGGITRPRTDWKPEVATQSCEGELVTTRRHFLAMNVLAAGGFSVQPARLLSESAKPDEASSVLSEARSGRNFWIDWPAYLTAAMNRLRSARLEQLAKIQSTAEMQERASVVRSRIWDLIGGEPERTPLNPRVTGTLDRDQYRIEKVVFESFPRVYVTANLYLPVGGKAPYPAILAPVGHSDNGKAYHYYQHLYQNLARKGYVVLAYDPFGQGERIQYPDSKTGASLYGPVGEHEQAGRPMVLTGDSFALYCAWDGIRGLDYLVSRPEVDARRLGCTGQSGGGTMTMYLAALEPRLHAAVVSEGNSEDVAGPFFDPPGATDDAEQNIVGGLPFGVDRGDLLLTFAPKPLLVCYTTHDEGVTYSPVYEEATRNIYEELQRVYGLFGAKEQVGLFAGHLPHGLDFFNRSQIYAWFNRWLDNPGAGTDEADLDIIPEKQLNVTSTGQVLTSLGGRSVVQLNSDRSRTALERSPFHNQSPDGDAFRQKAGERLKKLLALPEQRSPLHAKVRWSNVRKGITIEAFQFESEPGIRIPGWFLKPASPNGHGSTVLYLNEHGGNDVVGEPGSMDRLLAAGHAICAITLRGLDITEPRLPSGGPSYYGGEVHVDQRYVWTCLVMGRPVMGQRVWDAMRGIDYLVSRPDVDAAQIRVLGFGGAGLAALITTFLDPRPRSVLVNRTPVSYRSLVESEDYSLPFGWFVPGILREFDLPQMVAGFGSRPCWMMNGTDATGRILAEDSIREQIHGVHQESDGQRSLRVVVEAEGDPQRIYAEWLQQS